MKETLTMSRKERERMVVMDQVVQRGMTLVEGVDRMGVCYRQVKRIWGRYQARGAKVLMHRSRGLAISGWLANLHGCTGAKTGSLALRLASSLGGASTARIALAAARLGNGLKPARHTGRLENLDGPRPILRADWPTGELADLSLICPPSARGRASARGCPSCRVPGRGPRHRVGGRARGRAAPGSSRAPL